MGLLAGTSYDPSTAATSVAVNAVRAMAAIDTTNLRLTFTAPANGIVLVRLHGNMYGVTTQPWPGLLLGVMDGSTIMGRMYGTGWFANYGSVAADVQCSVEATFLVTGLTPSSSYTFDAAAGVEGAAGAGSVVIAYGGPNDTTAANAYGAFDFEIWEADNLLAGKLYDPSTRVAKVTTAAQAMTALDTTNLRLTFTAPASGNVLWRVAANCQGQNNHSQILLGILDGSTVRGRTHAWVSPSQTGRASAPDLNDASGIVTGLTPSSSYTWDAAYATEVVSPTSQAELRYGGPNDATNDNANGGLAFEIWEA